MPNERVKKLVKDKLASEDDSKRSEAESRRCTDRHIANRHSVVRQRQRIIAG
jgi:ribosome recycling factor